MPRNLPFKPTHEMLSLVGTTREQFALILDKLGYVAEGEGEDLTYRKKSFKKKARGPRPQPQKNEQKPTATDRKKSKGKQTEQKRPQVKEKEKEIAPDSPFAILKTLGKK